MSPDTCVFFSRKEMELVCHLLTFSVLPALPECTPKLLQQFILPRFPYTFAKISPYIPVVTYMKSVHLMAVLAWCHVQINTCLKSKKKFKGFTFYFPSQYAIHNTQSIF